MGCPRTNIGPQALANSRAVCPRRGIAAAVGGVRFQGLTDICSNSKLSLNLGLSWKLATGTRNSDSDKIESPGNRDRNFKKEGPKDQASTEKREKRGTSHCNIIAATAIRGIATANSRVVTSVG